MLSRLASLIGSGAPAVEADRRFWIAFITLLGAATLTALSVVHTTFTSRHLLNSLQDLEKQRNREFVFLQRNMGNPNYNLVNSTANGEVTDPSWRKLAAGRFGNNKKFGRNADEDGVLDNQGNLIADPIK